MSNFIIERLLFRAPNRPGKLPDSGRFEGRKPQAFNRRDRGEIPEVAEKSFLGVLWGCSAISAVKSFVPSAHIQPNEQTRPDNIEGRLILK